MVTPEIPQLYHEKPQAKGSLLRNPSSWLKELCDNIVRPNDDEIKVAGGGLFFSLKCLSMKKSGARIWIEWHMNGILDCLALIFFGWKVTWLQHAMVMVFCWYGHIRSDVYPFCSVKGNSPRGRWVLGHNMFGLCARIRHPHPLDMM